MFGENIVVICCSSLCEIRCVVSIINYKMSARHHLRTYDSGQEVGQLKAEQRFTTVAKTVGVTKNAISRLKKTTECANVVRKQASVRERNTILQKYQYVSLMEKEVISLLVR